MLPPFNIRILLISFFTLGLIYDQSTPIFEASDEVWHYGVVSEIASGRGLPIQHLGQITTYRQEGSQPPLYYALGAALTFWVDGANALGVEDYNPFAQVGVPGTSANVNMVRHTKDETFPWSGVSLAVHMLRLLSLLLGCGTVAVTYLMACLLFPGRTGLALLAAAIVAFNPMVVFISASVNNDNGIWFLSSLTMYVLVLSAKKDTDVQFVPARALRSEYLPWTLGVLLGLAILTKLSGLLLVPVVGMFLLRRSHSGGHWRRFWIDGIIITFCVLLLTGWWFHRNWVLYGEFLGTSTMAQVYGITRSEPVSLSAMLIEWRGWWYSLWGVFGAFNILPGQWVYALFTALVVLSILGGIRAVWCRISDASATVEVNLAHGLMLFFITLTLIGNVLWSWRQHALQGRLALGAVAPISIYLAAGLVSLGSKWREYLIASSMAVVLFIVCLIVAIVYVAPRYRPPSSMMETDLPVDAAVTEVIFDDEIELLGYSIATHTVRPGDTMQVTFYWRGLEEMDSDYNLAINVHGRDMEHIAKLDTWPGGGLLPTGEWLPGAVYADRYSIPLAETASAPTLLRLGISFWLDSFEEPLSMSANGSEITSLMMETGRLISGALVQELDYIANGSTFVEGITLAGYKMLSQVDSETRFILLWRADNPVATDWTVFVHLVNADGDIVSQADGPPLNGDWPTSAWQPGDPVRDPRRLAYNNAMPPGEYNVLVGLYDPATGLRAPAHGQDGSEWTDWAVPLMTIVVPE